MRRPRITIAALREPTDGWDGVVFGVTLMTLLTSVLLGASHTGRRTAFWLGFSLFGWAYLVASQIPPTESRLPTTGGRVHESLPGRSVVRALSVGPECNDKFMKEGVVS